MLTVVLDNPTGYGRIVRENGKVVGIVEQKDEQRLSNSKFKRLIQVVLVSDGASFKKWLAAFR